MLHRALVAIAVVVCLEAPAVATTYNVVPVGILPNGTSSTATSVDNSGEVAGYTTFSASGGSTEAFYWTESGGLVGLGGTNSVSTGVNNGNVVGIDHNSAFRWTAAAGSVPLDPTHVGRANGVNASGEVVGSRSSPIERVLTWSADNTITSPIPTGNLGGNAINDSGLFVGIVAGGPNGYYSDGSTTTLLVNFLPNSVSDNEITAGSVTNVASLYNINTSTTITIGSLPGYTASNAAGINPLGTEVVGLSEVAGSGADSSTTSPLAACKT